MPYVVLSVALSVFVSLFWLLVLVVAHVMIEWVRAGPQPAGRRLMRCLALTQLDWALLLAAVCMEVYLETAAGLAGAGQFARGLGRLLGRLPGWQQGMRLVLLSSDDALQLLRFKKGANGGPPTPGLQRLPGTLFVLGAVLLLLAPHLLPISAAEALAIAARAFRPIP